VTAIRIAAVLLAALLLATPAAAQLAAQKSSQGGVTVAVTPAEIADKLWSFKVVLDTHSQDLSDDLLKSAVLVDARGGEVAPVAWEGAAPGGHHREGLLKFEAIAPRPAALELRIQRPNEAKPRIFRWDGR
jgi:hypothetical protein